jgi:hypothetical protein
LQKHILRIKKKVHVQAKHHPNNAHIMEILDTLKQKLSVKSQRLRRYKEANQRKQQNRLFTTKEKTYYCNLKSERQPDCQDKLPDKQALTAFWESVWGNSVEHNLKASWIRREQTRVSNITAMEHSPITTEQVSRLIAKTLNWKAPGPDGISNFWIKRFTATHSFLAHYFNQFMEDAGNIPDFLVQGITHLLPKIRDSENPSKYRPITCLCTIYKIYTACIAEKICKYLETHKILAEEQKGCIKNNQGYKEQLIIDSVVMEQVHKDNRNLYIAYIDYCKAFDSVPHSWLIHVLEIYKIDPLIINSLQQLMKKWTTTLQVRVKNNQITSDPIRVQRGIYQGDSLSPLRFCLALNPLSHLLNRTNYGFGIHSEKQEIQQLNHILYMNDIKLYAAINNPLQELLRLTQTYH